MSPSELSDNYGDSLFMDLYHAAGYHPDILCRSTDIESILIMVAAEEGISIMPDYCVKKINNAQGLVFLPMKGKEEVEEIHAIWKKDNDNVALKHFIEQLQNNMDSNKSGALGHLFSYLMTFWPLVTVCGSTKSNSLSLALVMINIVDMS